MIRGGVADKLGNGYEAHWTLTEALAVLRGQADEIRLEPFNEDATGFEFRVTTGQFNVWHQCKRRRTSGSWTPHALATEGVLDAFGRKLAEEHNTCVFISSDPASAFKALTEKAALFQTAEDFKDALSEGDRDAARNVQAAWSVDEETLYDHLRRCRVETVSETSLLREAQAVSSLTFSAAPSDAIQRLIAFLDTKITHTLTTKQFRDAIDGLGLGWKAYLDETLDGKFVRATDEYLQSLQTPIAGHVIHTDDIDAAVQSGLHGEARLLIVAGAAGSGKSLAMANVVTAGRALGWPTLALRIDHFLSVQTIEEVGRALIGREESPVGLLGNRHLHEDCLLVIDQVDAVSEASGRSGRIREQLFQMIADSRFFPRMRVVVACRSYDLQHDSRLRGLATSPSVQAMTLEPLDWEHAVQPVMGRLGLAARQFSARERGILATPINLWVFANLVQLGQPVAGVLSGARLFDQLLEFRARRFHDAGISWTPQQALGAIAQSMSDNQELTAPIGVVGPFSRAADVLGSAGLITTIGGKLQFAHESFFDHVFSSHFVATGRGVHALLLDDEQRLFRRTQVRQIFSRLRDQGAGRTYLRNLADVMNADDVRYLVKDAVAYWLRGVDSPTDAELAIVTSWFKPDRPNEKLARTVFSGSTWLPLLIERGAIGRWIAEGGVAKDFALGLLQQSGVTHADRVAPFLRDWWAGLEVRLLELMTWFARLYPESSIGPLEDLYKDLVNHYPSDRLDPEKLQAAFDLSTWVHKNRGLGARVLAMWLDRWMTAFPQLHPFAERETEDSGYWIKELVDKEPEAFVEAVLPRFAEALRREKVRLDSGELSYPTICVSLGRHDNGLIDALSSALDAFAVAAPARVDELLDTLDPTSAPALFLHLRAIGANPSALGRRLPALLTAPHLFSIGDSGDRWVTFANAAKLALPFLSDNDRAAVETAIFAHRPEIAWAKTYHQRVKDGLSSFGVADPATYIRQVIKGSGQEERAILATLGVDQLSDAARVRLDQLERKFKGQPLRRFDGERAGFVRSPIDQDKAAKMNDSQWRSAMKRYAAPRQFESGRDFLRGGAEQLASVLQVQTKADPARFVELLEALPTTVHRAYVEAILSGVREGDDGGPFAARAIIAAIGLIGANDSELNKTINWTVQRHPEVGKNPSVLAHVLHSAEFGEGSDTLVTTTSPQKVPRTSVRELLSARDDIEMSGMNGERGSAFEALGSLLWENPETYYAVVDLVERRVRDERLTSVLMSMLRAVNAISKYDTPRGLQLLGCVARRDLSTLQSHQGRHILAWANFNRDFDLEGIAGLLAASAKLELQTLGLFLESGPALDDDARAAAFSARFISDRLLRKVAGFRASGNLTSDRVGDRAATWLMALFDDDDPEVRREAARAHWHEVLDGKTDRSAVVLAFIGSRAFEENSDQLMRALGERVDRFPEVTLAAVRRVVSLIDGWQADPQHRHYATTHGLPQILVELYRAVDGDSAREAEILGLFDYYLKRDIGEMRTKIGAYERH
jgi:hypothetical protein